MEGRKKERSVDEDVVMKYWPTVVDMKLLRDCTSCFEISGDAPAIIMENADCDRD